MLPANERDDSVVAVSLPTPIRTDTGTNKMLPMTSPRHAKSNSLAFMRRALSRPIKYVVCFYNGIFINMADIRSKMDNYNLVADSRQDAECPVNINIKICI